MTDTWNVTAAYDKPSYVKGDTIKITFSGGDVLTTPGTSQPGGALSLSFTAANGATTTITAPATTITGGTTTTSQTVKLTGVADTSGRVWTIAADGLSATAIA